MSANLEELEAQKGNMAAAEVDETIKREINTFINRYVFGYQHAIAKKALEELILQAKTHR